jgi:N-acetylglutamate synthase-like GNAT family acetyltransferase
MIIKRATLEHLTDICQIYSQLNTKTLVMSHPGEIKQHIKDHQIYTALDEDTVSGAITLVITDKSCEIKTLAIKKNYKNQGIGRKLILFGETYAIENNSSKLWCWSLKRYEVEQFYERMGFTERALFQKQRGEEDCYFFGKILQ